MTGGTRSPAPDHARTPHRPGRIISNPYRNQVTMI